MSLRHTFDSRADRYHRARPRYPAALFDRWQSAAGLGPDGGDVLEIGPASGVATEELARRGHRITAVELGRALADVARSTLGSFDTVSIVNADFDTWEPPAWGAFDAVVVATAWHWLDPDRRYHLAHRHLRPGGTLGFWSALHVVPIGGDRFFEEIQPIYDEIGIGTIDDWDFPKPGELETYGDEIESSGLFEVLDISHHDWEITYDATAYIDLLRTFSGHIELEPWQEERLYGEIEKRLSERSDGLLRRHWGAALHVARARN